MLKATYSKPAAIEQAIHRLCLGQNVPFTRNNNFSNRPPGFYVHCGWTAIHLYWEGGSAVVSYEDKGGHYALQVWTRLVPQNGVYIEPLDAKIVDFVRVLESLEIYIP